MDQIEITKIAVSHATTQKNKLAKIAKTSRTQAKQRRDGRKIKDMHKLKFNLHTCLALQ